MYEGKVIAIEGLDCCGKSTVIEYLKRNLKQANISFIREPGQTKLGEVLRNTLLNEKQIVLSDEENTLMFALDRLHTYEQELKLDKCVISDRSVFSSLAYQDNINFVLKANDVFLKKYSPDLVLFIDTDLDIISERLKKKKQLDNFDYYALKNLIHVRENYLSTNYKNLGIEFKKVNGNVTELELCENVKEMIDIYLRLWKINI